MEELERYECFGVPSHAWVPPAELAAIVVRPRALMRVPLVDAELLGIEAIPSPALADFMLHG